MITLLLALAFGCEPLDSSTFRGLVLDAELAADRGDAGTQGAVVEAIEQRISCMAFTPEPRLWANFLAQVALTRFGEDRDWQTPLTSALVLRPTLDRGVGGAHPIARFEVPSNEATPELLPEPVDAYVDGVQSTTWPADGRPHLAQVRQGKRWRSAWVVSPLASFWTQPIPASSPWRGWSVAGVRPSVVHRTQRRSDRSDVPGLRAPSFTATRAGLSLDLMGGLSYEDTIGHAAIRSGIDSAAEPFGSIVTLGIGRRLGRLELSVGPGLFWPTAQYGDVVVNDEPGYRRNAFATPMLASTIVLSPKQCSVATTLGAWSSGAHADARATCALGRQTGWSLGIAGQLVAGSFRQAGSDVRLQAFDTQAGLFLGWTVRRED